MKNKIKNLLSLLLGLSIITLLFRITHIGCPLKALTGISCAGCGMTRALIACCHFEFKKAFHYHPLFWTLPIIVVLYFLWDGIPKKYRALIQYFIITLFLTTYIIRLCFVPNTIVCVDIRSGWISRIIRLLIKLVS